MSLAFSAEERSDAEAHASRIRLNPNAAVCAAVHHHPWRAALRSGIPLIKIAEYALPRVTYQRAE